MFELIKFNNQSKKKTKLLEKLQIVKSIAKNAFTGYGNLTYIKITLQEIKLTKELFALCVEKQEEVFIPQRLSNRRYSLSYQFYDPIFQIIDSFCSEEKKLMIQQKVDLRLKMVKQQQNFVRNLVRQVFKGQDADESSSDEDD